VEAAAPRNLTNSDRATAFQYFLSDQCLSHDNPGVVSRVAFDMLRHEPKTASAMLKDAGSGPQKDAAIAALVRAFAGSDPEATFRWAQKIQNVELKTKTLAAIEKQRR
jgi:hypothetical protein